MAGLATVQSPGAACYDSRTRQSEWCRNQHRSHDKRETPGDGRIGQLARSGRISLGYYKDEAKTAATFPTDPNGVRWSVPGDLASIETDGVITVHGRGSASINSCGEKIFPEEVEAAIKACPSVFDGIVVGVPDQRFGERVAAVVRMREASPLSLSSRWSTTAGTRSPGTRCRGRFFWSTRFR